MTYHDVSQSLCEQIVSLSKMTVDHIINKRDDPSLAKSIGNLQPSHSYCNGLRDYLEIASTYKNEILKDRHIRIFIFKDSEILMKLRRNSRNSMLAKIIQSFKSPPNVEEIR